MTKRNEPTVLHTEATRAKVIAMYQEGHRLADITRETHVPRATIYWILDREGIPTDRVSRSSESMSAKDVLDRLRRAEQEIGRLEAELERERAITRWFLDQIVSPTDARNIVAEAVASIPPPRRPSRPRKQQTQP